MKITNETVLLYTYEDLYEATKDLVSSPIKSQLDIYMENPTELNLEDFLTLANSIKTLTSDFIHLLETFLDSDAFLEVLIDSPTVTLVLFEKESKGFCYPVYRHEYEDRIKSRCAQLASKI